MVSSDTVMLYAKVKRNAGKLRKIKKDGAIKASLKYFRRLAVLRARQLYFGAKLAWAYRTTKKNPKRPFFVLCAARTGSNLFISYLNSIPGVSFDLEIISRYQTYGLRRFWISKKAVFRHIRHFLHYRREKVRGGKLFFVHLEELKISLDELIREFPDAFWFVLYRKDILAQYLSYKIANQTQRWTRRINSPPEKPVQFVFDAADALAYRDRIRRNYQNVLASEAMCKRCLWISYEALAANPQKLFEDKVFSFLQVPPAPIRTHLGKQNLRPVAEVITNYAAVREFIEKAVFTQDYESEATPAGGGRPTKNKKPQMPEDRETTARMKP
ncbi:MAG: hypothetical protein A2Z83_05875 [Omnitrophica bacterium GWA2_52_8]|nr:MAG: hypothetical protein A2Z83_05875 [Omnitrophica bacterium GWA2_52_8]